MVTLSARLEAFDFDYQLEEIAKLLKGGRARISFWGTRMVTVNSSAKIREEFSLNYLAHKIFKAHCNRVEKNDIRPIEKTAGTELARTIKRAYEYTDNYLERANFITWLFALIREYTFDRHSVRHFFDNPTALRQVASC